MESRTYIFFGLLRGANSIKHTSLEKLFVIAVAALEVAVKHLIKLIFHNLVVNG